MSKKTEKKNQHIVSAVVLKSFAKNKQDIILDTFSLGDRLIFDRHSKNEYPKTAFYKVMKNDFLAKNDFILNRKNIIKPDDRSEKICYEHIYSLSNDQQDVFNAKFNILEQRDPYDIKYLIEDELSKTESKISIFYKHIKEEEINENNIKLFENEIIYFVQTNELRSLNIFNVEKVDFVFSFKSSYIYFDKVYFCNFISSYMDNYLKKSDSFEIVEVYNYLNSISLLPYNNDYADFIKKNLVKIGISNIENKHYMVINNKSDLKFILSDVATSIFYSNNIFFKKLLKFIGYKNINDSPKKITLMPLSPNIAVILSDRPFSKSYIEIYNIEKIKKFNSIFFSTNNEWLIIHDIKLKRSEIINESFLKKINENEKISNSLHWIKCALEKKSYSNFEFNYEKTDYKMYKNFLFFFETVNNIKQKYFLDHNIFNNDTIYIKRNKKNIIFNNYMKEDNIVLHIFNRKSFILYIKEPMYYNFFISLNRVQFHCLKLFFIREKILTEFYIDYNKKRLVCLNFNFELKEV